MRNVIGDMIVIESENLNEKDHVNGVEGQAGMEEEGLMGGPTITVMEGIGTGTGSGIGMET